MKKFFSILWLLACSQFVAAIILLILFLVPYGVISIFADTISLFSSEAYVRFSRLYSENKLIIAILQVAIAIASFYFAFRIDTEFELSSEYFSSSIACSIFGTIAVLIYSSACFGSVALLSLFLSLNIKDVSTYVGIVGGVIGIISGIKSLSK